MNDIINAQDILIPKDVDLFKWAVVACDQFNAQPDYWNELDKLVGDAPSTLRIIYPEVFLDCDTDKRIAAINEKMAEYCSTGIFRTVKNSFILVERDTKLVKGRAGLIMAVDLESYEYAPFSQTPVRATEKTLVERIPPRAKIREHASMELPHIILLIDDERKEIIEPLFEKRGELELLYSTPLNMNGGHIKGYRVENTEEIKSKIYALLAPERQKRKYGTASNFLFAVGDGNHSLATAKAHWDKLKELLTPEEKRTHPARFALVEVMNVHEESLVFDSINRIITGAGQEFIDAMKNELSGSGKTEVLFEGKIQTVSVSANSAKAITQITDFIDRYNADVSPINVEFVHGREHLVSTCKQTGGIGLFMPVFDKSQLFGYILKKGILPKKAFSMGEAEEKRYYLECHKIVREVVDNG